jgi:AraC-like DNA-binding protein
MAMERQISSKSSQPSAMPPAHRRPALRALPLGDTDPFRPTPEHPVRCRARELDSDNQLEPHHHAWGQLAYCARGLLQVTVVHPEAAGGEHSPLETTTIVPPSRAVWIPPLARHAVTIVESAQLLTLYIDASAVPAHWTRSRVLVVSPLLRELVHALNRPQRPQHKAGRALLTLLLDEMEHADTQPLGVPMPNATGSDRRLRNLCEAVMQAPAQHATLAAWATHVGASERTLARLFRDELGTSFLRWRQQVVLAHALPMLARGVSVGRVAEASGYASESAFSAMFKSAMGLPPTHLREQARAGSQAGSSSAARA